MQMFNVEREVKHLWLGSWVWLTTAARHLSTQYDIDKGCVGLHGFAELEPYGTLHSLMAFLEKIAVVAGRW